MCEEGQWGEGRPPGHVRDCGSELPRNNSGNQVERSLFYKEERKAPIDSEMFTSHG